MTAAGTDTSRRILSVRHLAMATVFLLGGLNLTAQGKVRIVVPAIVSFQVLKVGVSTVATNPSSIAFSSAALLPGQVLRISVKAEGDLTPPSGRSIPASKISWRTSNVASGIGMNGVLSSTGYGQVFQGQAGALSGGVNLNWTLAPPGVPLHAGNHQVVIRWKLEAVVP